MNTFDFITVPIIISIVYGSIELLKKAMGSTEKLLRFVPLIAAAVGAVLGVIAFFAMPEIIPASNAFVAILIGGASGLAATGSIACIIYFLLSILCGRESEFVQI